MKTAKLGAVFLVAVLALAGIGVGYATFYDPIYITGTADTGDLEYRITRFGVCEQGGLDEEWEPTWTGIDTYTDETSITVTVDPTYPGWYAYTCLRVHNTGDIPLKMYSMKITYVAGNPDLMGYYRFAIPTGNTWCQITGPVYWNNTFNWWTTEKYYSDLGIPYFHILPGASYVLGAYFYLDQSLPTGYENSYLTVTITITGTQAV